MTSSRRIIARAASSATLALVAGCAVGPDFKAPAAPIDAGYSTDALPKQTTSANVAGGAAQRLVDGQDIPGEWWSLYHSEPLNKLVETALKANPDLDAAQAALREAQENVLAGDGALYPTLTGNLSGSRQKALSAGFGSSIYSLYGASANVSYTIDIWGGTRRNIESLEARAEFQRYQLEASYLSLTANLVTAAITEASLRGQIQATEEIIRVESKSLDTVRRQLSLGGVARADFLTQQSTLAATQATLPPLQKQLAQERNLIQVYAGRFPNQDTGEQFDLAALVLPPDLPVSLPSKLVEQRPDVQAAEASLHAASAAIGVAIANELPQLTITGDLGLQALQIGKLFQAGSSVWGIGASATGTIFDGGKLLHTKRAADAAFDQAAAQYRSTVLSAFQDVANALRALTSDADALKAQLAAETAAADSLNLSQAQFQAGGISFLTLLTAQQTYQQAHIGLVRAQAARYADTAALFQALGGGWWNRSDVAAKDSGAAQRMTDAAL
ncbi:MAG TPA: efflux transporter outer membrane subunit [Aliidongia sp.]|uniref:efflux transporter outer membrane subunit n=1 Tax=Aliidongia sp. TaxID=1914230 RepID=UPI002DDCD647|nr:efflux transporter outer membrane subunit [Aliidongia sp.]HEV2674690.1 efflux transporter outer membrane subunit [Aliidongia sp.]